MNELVQEILQGNRRALARLLTHIENKREGTDETLAALFPHTGHAWVIGVTGAPGTGKSSLVNMLAKAYRSQNKTVGIIAVDPTSPFSGGAILGDRIRMRDLAGDSGVFIRSMAARGSLGGLARATRDAVRALDASGFDIVLVETVGAGQSEVDIVRTAHTTIVVEAPGMGDEVQAIKAGILEIADILIVNKADRPGADNTARSLKTMLEMGHPASRRHLIGPYGRPLEGIAPTSNGSDGNMWIPPVIRTTATEVDGQRNGINELIQVVEKHRQHLADAHLWDVLEQQRIEIELFDRLQGELMNRLMQVVSLEQLSDIVARIQARKLEPQQAVYEILVQQLEKHNT
jgi:LAO/AO transport system kinase